MTAVLTLNGLHKQIACMSFVCLVFLAVLAPGILAKQTVISLTRSGGCELLSLDVLCFRSLTMTVLAWVQMNSSGREFGEGTFGDSHFLSQPPLCLHKATPEDLIDLLSNYSFI